MPNPDKQWLEESRVLADVLTVLCHHSVGKRRLVE
jgi:hypothetical protein